MAFVCIQMKPILIALSGEALNGKDTSADYLIEELKLLVDFI